MGYVVDTNVMIGAVRDPERRQELNRFYRDFLPATFLHAVVAQELLVGANSRRHFESLEAEYVRPFERRGRLVTPTYNGWKEAARAIARLKELKVVTPPVHRSFVNDVLLAVSCREFGHTLVTDNQADFRRIRQVVSFDFVSRFPEAA